MKRAKNNSMQGTRRRLKTRKDIKLRGKGNVPVDLLRTLRDMGMKTLTRMINLKGKISLGLGERG